MIRQRSAEAIADSGLTSPPIDLDLIARRAGVAVRRDAPLPAGMRACYDDHRAEIRIRSGVGHIEERQALAHELGHHFLEHGGRECWGAAFAEGVVDLDDASGDVDAEVEANVFAGQLLLPRDWCRRDLLAGMAEPQIAERYDAPRTTTFIAIRDYRFRLPRRGRNPSRGR